MLKFLTKWVVLSVCSTTLLSQPPKSNIFISPLNIPLLLSGNYGELRATHFHSGLDLKTQGVVGKPVFAVGNGFVSRINIQSEGYGNSLYITHPNGYTSVYAHLDRFIPAIQAYVTKNQYERESFEIELFPPQDMFQFRQGDIIGYSGNTGRSGGPHLHFEIRNTDSQVPLNGLLFNLPIADNLPPVFRSLYIYGYPSAEPVSNVGESRDMYTVIKKNDTTYTVKETIRIQRPFFGFGADVCDFLNGSSNECGVYSMQLTIDNKPYLAYTIDAIPFDKSRYVNAQMDYDLKTNQKISMHRLFLLPNNKLPIYNKSGNYDLSSLSDDSLHSGEILAIDAYGNQSRLTFTFRHSGQHIPISNWPDSLNYISWREGAVYTSNKINIRIPSEALYEDILFSYSVIPGATGALSDTFLIFNDSEPLNNNIQIEVPLNNSSLEKTDKILFGRVNGSKALVAEGGEYKDGLISLSTRNFGKYVLICDTIAPAITPVSFIQGKKYTQGLELTFTVVDECSGLHTYNAFIDDKWALLKYDAKSNIVSYEIDNTRLLAGKQHSIKLIMVDGKNNRSEFEGQFIY